MDVDIIIRRLRLHGFHGVLPQENRVGADFYVTLKVTASVGEEALLHDRLEGTVDYSRLAETLRREMQPPCLLLERAAMRMASGVLRDFPQVSRAELLLEKENPPMGEQTEGVGVKILLVR
ncbi:MAG TPA: dihydroneopterin aldolase [Prevotellaceae bacterium]|nr:dihydroneopterin aldolase [Prevotellaceae bacterium]